MSERILRCKRYLLGINNASNEKYRKKIIKIATFDQLKALLEIIYFTTFNSWNKLSTSELVFRSKALQQVSTSDFKKLLIKQDSAFNKILKYDTLEAIKRAEANFPT